MKIVNDQLVYKDESNKKLGYEIRDGKSVLKLDEVNFNYLRGSKKSRFIMDNYDDKRNHYSHLSCHR
tara:strand:+ start:1225 stop:1425 length:201 start_codon:yes stop_codon:yes gene_type:complete